MKFALLMVGALALSLLGAACSVSTGTPLPATPVTSNAQGYPAPASTLSSYPGPAVEPVLTLPPGEATFQIDKPLLANATQVSGTGTPGVPLILHNVTFMGEAMGQTTVGSDGRFTFTVPSLEENVRLGISVGDLAGTRWIPEHFEAPGFRGSEPMSLPNVGYFLDTAQVESP